LIKNNTFEKDRLDYAKMYEDKKKNEASFYLNLIKRKFWIVGAFGIYLSVMFLTALLSQLTYNLALDELSAMLSPAMQIMGWGLIPFVLFWIVYIILFFFKSISETVKYQFGSVRGDR
jgi:uncharacterized membrane protein